MNYITILIAFILAGTTFSGPGEDLTLSVSIEGIRPGKGEILVALHNGPDSFNENPKNALALRKVQVDPNATSARIQFPDLPAGDYAVSVLKDENGNKKMDFTRIGAPREGYGVSNPPKSKFRRPKWEQSKFRVDAGNQRITIKMVYF